MKHLIATFAVVSALFIGACSDNDEETILNNTSSPAASTYSGKTARDYFSAICRISKVTPGFFPPQVARAYGYIGIANYEAVVGGIPGGQRLAGQLNGLSESAVPQPDVNLQYNWALSSNACLAEITRKMFEINISSADMNMIDSIENANYNQLRSGVSTDIVSRSVAFGKSVATSIYNYSVTDGGHHSYLDPFQLPYSVATDSFCWLPTGATTTPVSPKWGNNRPFITANITNTAPVPHVPFSVDPNSAFYQQAMVVYNQVKNVNTFNEVDIARYWADDPFQTCTPAGHTFNILTQLLEEDHATLAKTSMAFARLCIAENDAFISCWKGKYQFVLLRPVTYIKKYIDPSFNTVIGTPPFPAYTSGHSCEMGSAARIFTDLFTNGSGNYNFTDYSQLQYGFSPRNYSNFNDMANECADSRLYGGIHYPMDNSKGLQIGKAIGDNVNHLLNWPENVN